MNMVVYNGVNASSVEPPAHLPSPLLLPQSLMVMQPSRFKGVTPMEDEKWCAKISTYQCELSLGVFETEEYAALSYDRAMMKLGACQDLLNFRWPDPTSLELKFQSIYSISSLLNLIRGKTYDLLFTEYVQRTSSIWGRPLSGWMFRHVGFHPEVVLLRKELTSSDVGFFNRLVIPKRYALVYFPDVIRDNVLAEVGTVLSLVDIHGFVWLFHYKYWKSSKTFVITRGWKEFMRNKGLMAGDVLTFYWKDHTYRVGVIYRNREGNVNSNASVVGGAEEIEVDDYASEEVSDEVEVMEGPKLKKMRLFGVDVN